MLVNPLPEVHDDRLARGLGVQFQAFNPLLALGGASSPATQRIYGVATWGTAGAVVTGIKLRNTQAAGGTLPTLARFGLLDNTGKVLALSADLKALVNWPVGPCSFPLATPSAPYVLPYSGVYFPCFLVNGTWGTTQPTPLSNALSAAAASNGDGGLPPLAFAWAAQADFPAIGGQVTLTPDNRVWWIGIY